MIQRIQTLYLLLVVVLTGLALWLPLVDFTVGADTCTLTAFGLKDAAGITLLPTVYLGVVLVAACLVPLVTIFLFKIRGFLAWIHVLHLTKSRYICYPELLYVRIVEHL